MASGLRLVLEMAWEQDVRISAGRHSRLLAALGLVFVLALATACSRQAGVLSLIPPSGAGHDLPFDRGSQDRGLSPTQAFTLSAPIGSPIVVRLLAPLSSADARPGDSFSAVLDEPILIRGHILAQGGTPVLGRVAAARPCGPSNREGYLRLTLSSIATSPGSLNVSTSSIFAKGSARKLDPPSVPVDGLASAGGRIVQANATATSSNRTRTADAEFSTAQRLTFHLLRPLSTGP